MKFRFIICTLAAILILTGCGAGNVQAAQNTTMPQASDTQTTTFRVSREQALEIALEHAGLTADQVTGLRAEYDTDHGYPEYDVEFRYGKWEYDYEIDAETGEILSFSMDD